MQTDARVRLVSYATGGLQGLAFSLLPSLATLFTSVSYRLTPGMYGALFIPQTVFAVIGAFSAPALARRMGPMNTLRLGIVANLVALVALLVSGVHSALTYPLLMLDTAALGLGFGLCNSSANAMVEQASVNPDRAITMLNTLTGLGTSLSPAIFAALHAFPLHHFFPGYWQPWPLILACLFLCVLGMTIGTTQNMETIEHVTPQATPKILWLFALAAICYGTCEGSFSSWATVFSTKHHANALAVEISLTGFWSSLTAVRIVATFVPKLFPVRASIAPLAIVVAIVFGGLPFLHGSIAVVAGYLLGGASCGIIYPYLIANALHQVPHLDERVTGYLTGGLMIGEGFGSFAVGAASASIGLDFAYHGVAFVAVALAIIATAALTRSPVSTIKSSS